jgi:serine phosphatase RsbU (regulator of sigma subunit)
VRTGESQALDVVPEEVLLGRARDAEHLAEMRLLNTGPVLSVPLRSPSGALGGFTVGSGEPAALDEVLLVDLAARAGVALDNALTFARQRREATDLQRALLPREAAAVPGVVVATRYKPASAEALAGGDFFKTVRVGERLVMMLGDVMGHGTASAARAGQLHGLVAALALEGHAPGALLERLAGGIDQLMELELATLLVCSYEPATRLLTVASAGHPAPLVGRPGQPASYLELDPGAPLGVQSTGFAEISCELEEGATALLFSDGLVERRGESITVGLERLRDALDDLRLPPEAVADHVLEACGRSAGGDDDVALLVLTHLPD